MAFLAAFLPAIIGGGAAILGGSIAANGAKKAANTAANTQANVANTNNALQKDIYDQNKATLSPFVNQGIEDNTRINAFLKTNPFDYSAEQFKTDPGYQFRFDQGSDALNAQLAAGGRRLSGSASKAAIRYGQGMGSQEYGNAFTRYQTTQGRYLDALENGRGVGLTAASAQAGVGQGYANAFGANNQNAADARSNAALYNGAQNANLWSGIGTTVANAFGNSSYAPQPASRPVPRYDPFAVAGAY